MKHLLPSTLAAAAALFCSTAGAVATNLATGGFTGYAVTPNARLLGWGQFGFAYDRQLPGAADPSGHNFVAGFGLLPNLEVTGRLAANALHTNCFLEPCGIGDLSASAKLGMPLGADNRFHIAAGIADFGGAATNFRSVYGVLTYMRDAYEFSGGFARRGNEGTRINSSPLDGVFGSAAWQPLPWLRGHVEYTDRNAWAGVRLFAPASWLPQGWSAHVGANMRLTRTGTTERSWFSAGVSIPLYSVPKMRPAAQATQPASASPLQPAPPAAPEGAARPVSDAQLEELARGLQARGLEDISVGRMPDGTIAVRANNATYNWNTVDALGAALGATASALGGTRAPYRLVLTQRQVPIVGMAGESQCLQQWIAAAANACTPGEFSTPGTGSLNAFQEGASWVVRGLQPSWKTVRVQLTPVLRSNLGTEVGALDYSAGLNVGFSQPLWAGATADWRVQAQVAHSDDYGPGELLERRRVLPGTERLALTQTVGFDGFPALSAQASVGRITHHFDGLYGALRWEPGAGQHRVTAQGGWMRNSRPGLVPGDQRNATPLLLTYRYNLAASQTYLEATGGRFMNNDGGVQFGMRQWFGDVAVQLFLRRTRFSERPGRTVAGVEFSVPIGPRRDMQPSGFQVTGTPRFSHTVQTVVNSPSGTNPVVFGQGALPPAPSLDAVYNSDRAGLIYFRNNLDRLRDAAR